MPRLVWILLILAGAVARAEDPELPMLRRHGLAPTYESLRSYLRALYPGRGTEQEFKALIADLGHSSAPRREFATRALLRGGAAAAGVLNEALDSGDPEVVRRVRWLLEEAERMLDADPMYATYMTIARRRILGLAEEVIRTLPMAKEGYVYEAGCKALEATATPASAGVLREAAVRALAAVLRNNAAKEMAPLLADEDLGVRLAAAMALAQIGDKASLGALVTLLEAPTPQLRFRAVVELRKLTGRRFKYAAWADEQSRRPEVELWRKWVREQASDIDWEQARHAPVGVHNRILIALNGKGGSAELIEIDLDGTVITRRKLRGILRGVHGMRNGHRLAAFADRKLVVEYDAQGKEVWRSPTLVGAPASVQRLSNGSTLIAFPAEGQVHEILKGGETALVLRAGVGCNFAQRLASGITRVAVYNTKRVIDLERDGKLKREKILDAGPLHFTELDNGNLLVCLALRNRVDEIDRNGKVLGSLKSFAWPTAAFRIANGVTIVSDKRGVWKVTRDGHRHHIFVADGTVRISYY